MNTVKFRINIVHRLVFFLFIVPMVGLVSGSAHWQQPQEGADDTVKAFITDYNLIKRNDRGTLLGMEFLLEIYQRNPKLDPAAAVSMTQMVVESWKKTYGPDRRADFNAREKDFKSLIRTIADFAVSKKVDRALVENVLGITYREWARRDEAAYRKLTLMIGEETLRRPAVSWGGQYSLMQQPGAIVHVFQMARENPQLSGALTTLLKPITKVNVHDPVSEWRRENPDAHQVLKQAEIEGKIDKLVASSKEIQKHLRKLERKITNEAPPQTDQLYGKWLRSCLRRGMLEASPIKPLGG